LPRAPIFEQPTLFVDVFPEVLDHLPQHFDHFGNVSITERAAESM
jgi:hypothetical protein